MTATLAAAPSQQHPRSSSKPAPLWGLRLHGVPCHVCERPAVGMNVYPGSRLIYHLGAPPCALPNPASGTPDYRDAT